MKREWIVGAGDRSCLPPALRLRKRRSICLARSKHGYICTRLGQHTGRHAASGASHVLEVWA